jgi:hypothetical protein
MYLYLINFIYLDFYSPIAYYFLLIVVEGYKDIRKDS